MERQICRFFLQGNCRFGPRCFNSHDYVNGGFVEGLLIRHAESEFNKVSEYFDNDFTGEEAKKQFQFNPTMIDCRLSPKGIQQASRVRLPTKDIDIIFVSPLERALETTELIIKKNKLATKHIIVLPQLTEVLSKICDFGSSLKEKRKRYKKFDFGEMNRFLKQNDHINGEEEWQDVLVDMDHYAHIQREAPFGERYLFILQSIFPTPLESSERCFGRSQRALEIIKDIMKNLKASRAMVVSHNRILRYMDGRHCNGRSNRFENCEIRNILF